DRDHPRPDRGGVGHPDEHAAVDRRAHLRGGHDVPGLHDSNRGVPDVSALIRVWPARGLRRAFAEWAVAQTPLVRTVSESEFGVPPHLFPQMPEPLLAGARIDGQPYVPSSRPAASARRVASAPLP